MGEPESFEALQLSYDLLKKEAAALQHEWEELGVTDLADSIEVDFLEEQTAKELGVAGAVALGTALVHTTVKAILPAKVVMPLISGAWFLGGAFIIFRVTASTAAGWAAMTQRNARRKLMLHTKLEAIEHRIAAMNALSTGTLGPPPQPAPLPPTETQSAETHAAGIKRPSPTGSTGSSIEMVEAPLEEEERGGKNASGSAQNRTSGAEGAAPSRRGKGSFESWKAYASLGGKKTE